jgi:hypothetical protein
VALDKSQPERVAVESSPSESSKGRATPTRKEREAANQRPLVASDRKVASKEYRAQQAEARNRARIGMAAGEEKYLPLRDRGVQRRYARDYVDARYNVGELMVPFMFLVIIMTFLPDQNIAQLGILTLWGFFIIAIIDVIFATWMLRRRIEAKFGEGTMERGIRWYAAMRTLQMRQLRLPKPQVKRRAFPS